MKSKDIHKSYCFVFSGLEAIYFCTVFLSNNLLFIWFQVGPLRCWPGGLCLSRSIGDMDVGEFIVPVPHVKQVKVTSHFVLADWSMLCFHSCVYCIAW